MKTIDRNYIPCWYELSWRKKIPAVKIRLHKDFIKNTIIAKKDSPIVVSLCEEFGFEKFTGDFSGNFGFDDSFIRDKETKEFVEFIVKIPKVKKKTGKHCSYCKGSGKNNELYDKCLFCNGTGKKSIYDWGDAYAISASFTVFTVLSSLLSLSEKETSSSLLQLMEVSTITQRGAHGGSLDGRFSTSICNWMDSLRKNHKPIILEMIEAMQLAHKVMFGLSLYEENNFRASIDYEGGWLNTTCPGDACGLNPSHMGVNKGFGYDFSCHNVDTPAQQLELIASLAALHDKARKEM